LLLGLSVLAAAGILYTQTTGSGASDGTGVALAAISQAIPLHATAAVSGDSEALAKLDNDLQQLANLRRNLALPGMPGGADTWDELTRYAEAIIARRADIETVVSASAFVAQHMPVMLTASDELLTVSGSTAVVQEFQTRGATVQNSLALLAANVAGTDAEATVASIATNMAYLRMVTDALSGAATNLDVAPLDDATRELTLMPIISELMDIEAQVEPAVDANLAGIGNSLSGITAVSSSLLESEFSDIGSGGGGILAQPVLPIALLGFALSLVIGLIYMNSR
jgi:hypothetical protein